MESETQRAALLWSGGKDAMLALDALRSAEVEVAALVTTIYEPSETVTIHGVPLRFVQEQARALKLPLSVMRLPKDAPNSTYEARLEETLAPLRAEGIRIAAAGDLFLEDVRAYREVILEQLGFTPRFPLWRQDPERLARRFIAGGYRATVCCVDTTQLDASFAGHAYDRAFLDGLPPGVDPCGERGAFHTFVTDGPSFAAPVPAEAKGVRCGERFCMVQWKR